MVEYPTDGRCDSCGKIALIEAYHKEESGGFILYIYMPS